MKKLLFGMVGVAGLAASASAVTTWTTNLQFVKQGAGPVGSQPNGTIIPAGGALNLLATGVYTFQVQVGIFNFASDQPNQTNRGLWDWTGNGTGTGLTNAGETLGLTQGTSRQSPFNYGPATSFGGTLVGNSAINGIDASRDVAGGATQAWNFDTTTGTAGPMPTGPIGDGLGANAFTTVFRFTVNVTSTLAGPNIQINFAGSAGPILRWEVFGSNPPSFDDVDGSGDWTPGTDTPINGNVSYLGITRGVGEGGPAAPYNTAGFTLTRVPAPGSLALLGLGGLIAARRRRA